MLSTDESKNFRETHHRSWWTMGPWCPWSANDLQMQNECKNEQIMIQKEV